MALFVAELGIQLIEALQPLVPRIKQKDRSLADQLARAATSVCLNIAEAQHSEAGNRRSRFFTAAGSASEALMAVRVAVAWRYLRESEGAAAQRLLNRILAILWKLTH